MTLREIFVEKFSEEQAVAFENAAEMHRDQYLASLDNKGSDHFRWVLVVTIGYDCFMKERYRKHHGITIPPDDIRSFIINHANIGEHDGDYDRISMLAGIYEEYIKKN